MQVNLFNAIYLGFFLAFIVSPRTAERLWGGLVAYCEFVIVCIYMYNFTVVQGIGVSCNDIQHIMGT